MRYCVLELKCLTENNRNYFHRDGKLILTALATGRVPLINATKSLGFVLAQVVLTLAWASGEVLISNPAFIH